MHIRKFPSPCGSRGCVVLFHLILEEKTRRGIFRCKSDRNERGVASLSRSYCPIVETDRSDWISIGWSAVHSLDPRFYSNARRAYRIDRNRGDRLLCDETPIQWDIGRIILLRVENAAGCARRKGVFEELAAPVHCSFYYYVFIWEIVRKIVRFLWRWKANEIEIGESQSIGNY